LGSPKTRDLEGRHRGVRPEALAMISVRATSFPILPVMLDGEWVGFSALVVREVLPAGPWVPIAGASDETPGIAFWKRRPIAVIDLQAMRGDLPALVPGVARARLLLVNVFDELVAVPVDAAREVRDHRQDDVPVIDLAGLLAPLAHLPRPTAFASSQRPTSASDEEPGTSTFVVLRERAAQWAIPASRVQRMLSIAESAHVRSVDFFELLGGTSSKEDAASRVLVLSCKGRDLAVRVPRDIVFRRIAQSEIHGVPRLVRRAAANQTIAGLSEIEDQIPLFVVDPEGLPAALETLGARP
jgi:chemotaxis signal transduction protein